MGGRTYDREDEVKRNGTILIQRKEKECTRNSGRSGILMLHGGGLGLMNGTTECTIRMDGSAFVMVKCEGKRERDKKQREDKG